MLLIPCHLFLSVSHYKSHLFFHFSLSFPSRKLLFLFRQKREMSKLWTFLSQLSSFAGPSLMLIYPLVASIKAIESQSKLDDEQWLAYWILYSFLTLFEMVAEPILYWLPIWYPIKVVLAAWLVLPHFRGASFIYEKFVREQLIRKHGPKLGYLIGHKGMMEDED